MLVAFEMFEISRNLKTTWRTAEQWSTLETEVDGDLGHDERGDDAGDQIHAVVVQYLLPCTNKKNLIKRLRGFLHSMSISAVSQPVPD
jgi:hypothetical protein